MYIYIYIYVYTHHVNLNTVFRPLQMQGLDGIMSADSCIPWSWVSPRPGIQRDLARAAGAGAAGASAGHPVAPQLLF